MRRRGPMPYHVIVHDDAPGPGGHDVSMKASPSSFGSEDNALEYAFGLLERSGKHARDSDILCQIHGPDGFLMNHAAVMERYRKWYWLKTGGMP
jgi:hypothetical protein